MVVLKPQSEIGYAPPPQTPYSIITNLPGWDENKKIRDGDFGPAAKMVHVYPRFSPSHYARQLAQGISKKLGVEGQGVLMFLNPEMWPFAKRHITSPHRKEHVMKPEDVTLRCVEVSGHRLYVFVFNPMQGRGIATTWSTTGTGISIRGGELLLKGLDDLKEVPVTDELPQPTWTPETEAHEGLKKRVSELLHRAPRVPDKAQPSAKDVFLHPTGMASIFHTSNTLLKYQPGTVIIAGVVFHDTHELLKEECPQGFKHIGKVDDEAFDELATWLESEAKEGRKPSYLMVEFPGNPTLDTPDLARCKLLSEKYGFVLVVDDTLAGFANVDVTHDCDILLTSLTKSFSGYANVLGGSIALNPVSPHYASLSSLFSSTHRNELFAPDAEVLLSNSQDLLDRTKIYNRNAEALASYLHAQVSDPESPVSIVQYPTVLPSRHVYDRYKRPSTPDFPEPGYGCLMTVEFESYDAARAFYNSCGFYPSPHLGGHVTIMFLYNLMSLGSPEEREYFDEFGVREKAVRISVGLEDAQDLIDTFQDALHKTVALKKNGYKVAGDGA